MRNKEIQKTYSRHFENAPKDLNSFISRAKTPTGWIVLVTYGGSNSSFFMEDKNHEWKLEGLNG